MENIWRKRGSKIAVTRKAYHADVAAVTAKRKLDGACGDSESGLKPCVVRPVERHRRRPKILGMGNAGRGIVTSCVAYYAPSVPALFYFCIRSSTCTTGARRQWHPDRPSRPRGRLA